MAILYWYLEKIDPKPEYVLFKRDGNIHIYTKFINIVASSDEMGEGFIEVWLLEAMGFHIACAQSTCVRAASCSRNCNAEYY